MGTFIIGTHTHTVLLCKRLFWVFYEFGADFFLNHCWNMIKFFWYLTDTLTTGFTINGHNVVNVCRCHAILLCEYCRRLNSFNQNWETPYISAQWFPGILLKDTPPNNIFQSTCEHVKLIRSFKWTEYKPCRVTPPLYYWGGGRRWWDHRDV